MRRGHAWRIAVLTAAGAALTLAAAPPSLAVEAGPTPGPDNAITDVPGILVGQVTHRSAPYLTGTTVVYPPKGAVGGVDVRGGAPGSRETDLLDPRNKVQRANAVVLTGGSAYGLDTATGVMRWLEEHGKGFPVGRLPSQVVPIVPAAVIFDLGRGGAFKARPTADDGYRAIDAAGDGAIHQGVVGAGTGALAGGLKGGVGTASVRLPDGTMVGAIVAVNASGSAVDPGTCTLYGAELGLPGEFEGLRAPKPSECGGTQGKASAEAAPGPDAGPGPGSEPLNTTIAVVATDAPLDKAEAQKMAGVAHDGIARAIRPVHTLNDGDTVFALSTGEGRALDPDTEVGKLNEVYNAGADALSRAIAHAMLSAGSVGPYKSYCDTYPSACAHLGGKAGGGDAAGASAALPDQPAHPVARPRTRLVGERDTASSAPLVSPEGSLLAIAGALTVAAAAGAFALARRRSSPRARGRWPRDTAPGPGVR